MYLCIEIEYMHRIKTSVPLYLCVEINKYAQCLIYYI